VRPRLYAHHLLALHPIAHSRQPPVNRDRAGADPALQARAAVLRETPWRAPDRGAAPQGPPAARARGCGTREAARRSQPRSGDSLYFRGLVDQKINEGPSLTSSFRTWRAWLAAFMALAMLSGCGLWRHRHDDKFAKQGPDGLYKIAHKQLQSYDFKSAIKTYEALTARFPVHGSGAPGAARSHLRVLQGGRARVPRSTPPSSSRARTPLIRGSTMHGT